MPISYLIRCVAHVNTGELKTGYLEKRVGEHSGRQSVPLGESFKWQKRYFVLTEPKGMLYYFKSADDPPNYRGVINLRCVQALLSLYPSSVLPCLHLDYILPSLLLTQRCLLVMLLRESAPVCCKPVDALHNVAVLLHCSQNSQSAQAVT